MTHGETERARRLVRSASGVGLGFLASRIVGYVRDVMFASAFGTGMFADAFVAAFRIPNLLRHLFAEGGLTAAFVPVFTEEVERRGKKAGWELATATINQLTLILIVISFLGILAAPGVVWVIAAGFRETAGKSETTVRLLRIMFPYILLIGLTALAGGILNSLRHFAMPAIVPVVLNVSMIVFLLFAVKAGTAHGAMMLGIAVLVGGLGQLALQLPVLFRKGFKFRLKPWHHPLVPAIAKLMVPAAVGLAVYEVNIMVNTLCASFRSVAGEGAVTAIYFSSRLYQLPLALFGTSLATVVFPELSSASARSDMKQFRETVSFGLRQVLVMSIPAACGLIVLRRPIIEILFQHRLFDAHSTEMTAAALLFYSAGLPFYASVHILSRAFYSMRDTKTPVAVAIVAMVTNAVLDVFFLWGLRLGVGGLALATAIASAVNAVALGVILRRRIGMIGARRLVEVGFRVSVASAAMGAAAYFTSRGLPFSAAHGALIERICAAAIPIAAGVVTFAGAASLLRLREVTIVFSALFHKVRVSHERSKEAQTPAR